MMHTTTPPISARHEADLQERRLERKAEDCKLDKLKARLSMKVREQQKQRPLARAS
jgi:hypothetical protein